MAAESGDFDDFTTEAYMHDAKTAADDTGVAKQRVHGFRRGICRDVKVLGMPSQQEVAHCAPHEVGLVPAAAKPGHYLESAVADVFTGYAVLIPGHDFQTVVPVPVSVSREV